MPSVIPSDQRRAARLAARRPTDLVVWIGTVSDAGAANGSGPVARVGVSVRDRRLAARLTKAMTRTLRAAVALPIRELSVVRVASRRAVERLGKNVEGTVAIVPLTRRNLRRAAAIVEGLRVAGAAGVQVAWNGCEPARESAEATVFKILERARATPSLPPVVLAHGTEPVAALRILIAHRR
jgi:hypothetical protein